VTGAPVLTLAGVLAFPGTTGAQQSVSGVATLTAGTVVIAHASCPEDPHRTVRVTLDNAPGKPSVIVCGDGTALERYDAEDGDLTPAGEGYLFIQKSGDYTVTITADTETPTSVSVQVFADVSPTVVENGAFPADGVSGTLSGVGDTTVVWLSTGSDESATWSLQGASNVCTRVNYRAIGTDGAARLGAVCGRTPTFGLTSNSPEQAVIIFNRTEGPADFSLTRTG